MQLTRIARVAQVKPFYLEPKPAKKTARLGTLRMLAPIVLNVTKPVTNAQQLPVAPNAMKDFIFKEVNARKNAILAISPLTPSNIR